MSSLMEIDSEVPLSTSITELQKLVSDILNSSQSIKYSFLLKAVSQLDELRELMNQREIEEYVSFGLILTIFS